MKLDKVLYTAQATATGGRKGRVVTPDDKLDLNLTPPVEMGGTGEGTNPEQLFACAYSACFLGAIHHVAEQQKLQVPADASITGLVGIGTIPKGFSIQVELKISLPGMDRGAALALIHEAHVVCPYSNATRGNIEVGLTLV